MLKSSINIVYCTKSPYKLEEWKVARDNLELSNFPNYKLREIFEIEFREITTREPLNCDLHEMVRFKAQSAYEVVRVPCIVEHAGLILEVFEDNSFPGGLTQPMWDALSAESFVSSCHSLSKRAIARSVIGYCDGMSIKTFAGETRGELSKKPKGAREFYWDTVFCPDGFGGKTYAEIAQANDGGLLRKLEVSQSIKALMSFMEYRIDNEPILFDGF